MAVVLCGDLEKGRRESVALIYQPKHPNHDHDAALVRHIYFLELNREKFEL